MQYTLCQLRSDSSRYRQFPIQIFKLSLRPRNGTDWAYATWRHVSDTGQVFSVEGRYGRVAPCPQLSAEQAQAALAGQLSSGIVAAPAITTRSRRQSDVAWYNGIMHEKGWMIEGPFTPWKC